MADDSHVTDTGSFPGNDDLSSDEREALQRGRDALRFLPDSAFPAENSLGPLDSDLALVPIYHARDDYGSSSRFYFKAAPSLNDTLGDLLRKYPMFRNRGTLLRSLVYCSLNKLLDESSSSLLEMLILRSPR